MKRTEGWMMSRPPAMMKRKNERPDNSECIALYLHMLCGEIRSLVYKKCIAVIHTGMSLNMFHS